MTQRNTTAQEPSDTGGPAFPRAATQEMMEADCFAEEGMTLLDYFAGQALEGFMQAHGWISYMEHPEHREHLLNTYARDSYAIAAAMLAEKRRRERPPATAKGEQS